MSAALLSLVFSAFGVFAAALAFRFRNAPTMAGQSWFAVVALTGAILMALNAITYHPASTDLAVTWAARVQLLALAFHVLAWVHYAGAFLGRPSRLALPATAALLALAAASLVPGAVLGDEVSTRPFLLPDAVYRDIAPGPGIYPAIVILVACYGGVLVRFLRGWREGREGAGGHLVAMGAILLFGLNDGLVTVAVYRGPYLLDLGLLLPVVLLVLSAGGRVVNDSRQLAELQHRLEDQVRQRTEALVHSEQALRQAEQLMTLGRISAGLAHQVFGPVAAIGGNLRYAAEELRSHPELDADFRNSLLDATSALGRLERVAEQLREASRLAMLQSPPEVIDVRSAVEAARGLSQGQLGKAVVTVDVPPSLEAIGRRAVVERVLVEILLNAAEGRSDGPVRVQISAEVQKAWVAVRVRDDGPWRTATTLERLFVPFLDPSPAGKSGRLGMALSRSLAQGLGGDVQATSAPGQGTTVTLLIPMAPQRECVPGAPERGRTGKEARHPPGGPPRSAGASLRSLVARATARWRPTPGERGSTDPGTPAGGLGPGFEEERRRWREGLLTGLLLGTFAAFAVATLWMWFVGEVALSVVGGAGAIGVLLLSRARAIPFVPRVAIFLSLLVAGGLGGMMRIGALPNAFVVLSLAVFVATLLLGQRGGFLMLGVAAAGILLVSRLLATGVLARRLDWADQLDLSDPAVMLRSVTIFLAVNAVMVVAPFVVIRRAEGLALERGLVLDALGREKAERARVQEELALREAAYHRAQELEVLGRLSGTVAHDFNNALTIMHAALDALEQAQLPGHLSQAVADLRSAAGQAAATTRQLRVFGRSPPQTPAPVPLAPLLERASAALRRVLPRSIEVALELGTTATVLVEEDQLLRILTNLAINARDAMREGGRLTLRLREVEGGSRVAVDVIDTGVGMSEEVQVHIFEPYFTTKGEHGTGLGLASVRRVIEAAGGHVAVESGLGRGTTVSIELPKEAVASPRTLQ